MATKVKEGKHKLSVTRPKFLLGLMGGDIDALTMSNMKKSMYDSTPACYAVYTVLMEADIQQEDIVSMNNDGEAIAVTLSSKALAKRAKELCNKEVVRYGSHQYRVKLKQKDAHLIADVERLPDEDEEESGD